MSAQDNLSPKQFYHGTDRLRATGDMIDPERSKPGVQRMHGGAYTFATTDPSEASTFGRHVYKVDMTNPEPDPRMDTATAYRSKHPLIVTEGADSGRIAAVKSLLNGRY